MPNQITGRLVYIGQPQEIPSKSGGNPFVKREFILDATTYDPYTGERSQYENVLPLEVSGDKCAELDQFRTGDVITVSFFPARSGMDKSGRTTKTHGVHPLL